MLEIIKLDHFGRGIGKLNNKIIFIENALPEEIVDIKITKEKKKYCEGIVTKYRKKVQDRIEPICPYYNYCGGCDIMHMSYDNQLKFKQNKIENIMSDLNIKINNIIKSDDELFYRNKITFQINHKLGLFEKESNKIIEIDKCYLANNKINSIIKELKELDLNNINKIIVKNINNQLMIIIESDKEIIIPNSLEKQNIQIYQKIKNEYKKIYNNNQLTATINDKKYQISPDSFFQVNINTTVKLYNKVKEYCKNLNSKNILDLYCGTGTIGIYVSDIAKKIIGIEINNDAINDAKINASLNNTNNITFICNDVEKELDKIKITPDTIIVDPPRSGLSSKTIETIFKIDSKNLIYISCDPMTLKRDLKILNEKYNIIELTPFDMFPQTHHIETVVLMSRM